MSDVSQVTEQTKAGHVSGSTHADTQHRFSGGTIQRNHARGCMRNRIGGSDAGFDRGRDYTGADRFGENQHIAGPRAGITNDSLRVHLSQNTQTILRFAIVNRVTANDGNTCLQGDVTASAQDVLECTGGQQIARECDQVESKQRPRTHRVDIRQRVRGRDAAKVERVVYDGREEVDGRHQRPIASDAVHSRIVRSGGVDQNVGVLVWDQVTQDLRQLGRAEFTRSTRAVTQLRKPELRPPVTLFLLFHEGGIYATARGWRG